MKSFDLPTYFREEVFETKKVDLRARVFDRQFFSHYFYFMAETRTLVLQYSFCGADPQAFYASGASWI